MDVRAPIEFQEGHFPTSINLPLINNDERHQIGIEYKTHGQEAAIRLGHELVQGATREARIQAWEAALERHPQAHLYCFRGGLRSQTSVRWLAERGKKIPLVPGGYKALRKFLMQQFGPALKKRDWLLVDGKTGVGKTEWIHRPKIRSHAIDLENLARHRGSAFGATGPLGTQPSQATFENALFVKTLKLASTATGPHRVAFLESESRSIGALQLPGALVEQMESSKVLVLELSLDLRVSRLIQEYVFEKLPLMQGNWNEVRDFHVRALDRIAKKLGDAHHRKIRSLIHDAFLESPGHSTVDAPDSHRAWVEALLTHYYDPLYLRQLDKKKDRIVATGTAEELEHWVLNRHS